jgi:hypothetical protein
MLNRLRFRRKIRTVTTKFNYSAPLVRLQQPRDKKDKIKDIYRKRTINCRRIIKDESSPNKSRLSNSTNKRDSDAYQANQYPENVPVRKESEEHISVDTREDIGSIKIGDLTQKRK